MKRNLKLIITMLCISFFSQQVKAQVDSVKILQIKNKLIDSICACISRTDTNSVNNVNDAQIMLTKCVEANWDLYYNYITVLANQPGTLSQETVQKISKYIAAQIYAECPAMRIRVYHVQHQ